MPLPKVPTSGLDDINHRRRTRETLNQVLDHTFDDSRVVTAAEVAAGVTPINKAYPPYWVPRYGENTTPGTTNMTAAIQAAINAAAEAGQPAYLPGWIGRCLVTSELAISASSSGLVGDGSGFSQMVFAGCGGITVADGLQFVHISGLSIAAGVRWTDTPHSYNGVTINGTSLSPVFFSRFDDLFIDGFEANFIANGASQCFFSRIDGEFCNRGFVSEAKSFNCFIDNCAFVGAIGSSAAGITIGDGSSAAEGWVISDSLIYGFGRGVWGYGCNNSQVSNCIIDFFTEYGVLLQSNANAATNWLIQGNYMAATGASGSTGVRLLSSTASSDPRGTKVIGNDILVYAGSTLTRGILVDGTSEVDNTIALNSVNASTQDCSITVGAGHRVIGNKWLNVGFGTSVMVTYEGNDGPNLSTALTRQTNGANHIYHCTGAAPAAGTFLRGDIAWETAPAAAGVPGYVCVTGGSPGTWKAMAALAP